MPDFDASSWIDSVVGGARNPYNWLSTAEGLRRAADLLREDWLRAIGELPSRIMAAGAKSDGPKASVGSAAMLLAGYAIETVLKGLLIAQDPSMVEYLADLSGKIVHWNKGGHDLAALAQDADLSLNDEEKQLLVRLTEFITWAGRYPISLRPGEMRPRPVSPTGGASFDSSDFEAFSMVFDRLKEALLTAAEARQLQDEVMNAQQRKDRRKELELHLQSLRRQERDGVQIFESGHTAEPGALIACGCGTSIELNPRFPAAICRCETLYYGEKRGVAGRIEFAVDSYPVDNG